ncbi:MAG: helix-turn-helix domain-containing protein [Oscillospiraceae bacterium]|nr:helix-turn-helix domain-containing protein [Oscillospiraceae bacterium]
MKQFGQTIKTLRRQKDMTQEQLAEYLDISPQAISRWEINSTLPDITLIPKLAHIFDVTTDVLFGVDIATKNKRIDELLGIAQAQFRNGDQVAAADMLRTALQEYPNSYPIMSDLMTYTRSEEEKTALGEKILAGCTDDACRQFTRERLCQPKGTKRFELLRQKLFDNITDMMTGLAYNCAVLDDGGRPYTAEEMIVNNQKMIDLIHLLFDDGNIGFYRRPLAQLYIQVASFCARLGEYDRAIENLKLAAKHAMLSDQEYNNTPEPDKVYTSLPFKGMKLGGYYITQLNCATHNYLAEMAHADFDAIRQTATFVALEENVRAFANKK